MSRPIRVLVVDDDAALGHRTADALESAADHVSVETAKSVDQALEMLGPDIDCVVSSANIAGVSGIEFLQAVRERDSGIPFILFAGSGSDRLASDAISAGLTDYVRKDGDSVPMDRLATCVLDAVEQYREHYQYEQIFEAIPDGIVIHDPDDGSFVDLNEQYASMFGYDRDELLDAGFQAIHPDDSSFTIEEANRRVRAALDGEEQDFEWKAVRKSGEEFWAEVHLRKLTLQDEARVLAAVRDITDRKERERELETIRERMEFALDATDSVIWSLDLESGQSTNVGPVERLFGRASGEMEGFLETVVHPDDRETVVEVWEAVQAGETDVFDVEFRTRLDAADAEWVASRGFVQDHDDGGSPRLIGLATDITDRKHREQELQERNERLDEFASIVSHDLRNPLNVASGHLELAREGSDDPHLDSIKAAHDRMATLIQDLLALARDDEFPIEPEPIDLERIVDRTWETLDTDDATLTVESTGTVWGDDHRMRQLFENLLQNAIEHGGADVTLRVGPLDDGFYVEDDGPGIPPEDREQIFEAGYSANPGGTGFGLRIVQQVVNAHDGTIEVCDADTGGARFEVRNLGPR